MITDGVIAYFYTWGGRILMKKMCRILACVGTLLLTACTVSNNRSTQITSTSVTEQKKETPEPKETVSPEVTEAFHAYNELLDNIDAYDFGMGDVKESATQYSVVYLDSEVPQLLVTRYYDREHIAMNMIFWYESSTKKCMALNRIFQTINPSQNSTSDPEGTGMLSLLEGNKGLVYAELNQSTNETIIKQLLTYKNNEIVVRDLGASEYGSLPNNAKLISLPIDDRRLLQ